MWNVFRFISDLYCKVVACIYIFSNQRSYFFSPMPKYCIVSSTANLYFSQIGTVFLSFSLASIAKSIKWKTVYDLSYRLNAQCNRRCISHHFPNQMIKCPLLYKGNCKNRKNTNYNLHTTKRNKGDNIFYNGINQTQENNSRRNNKNSHRCKHNS